MSATIVAWDVGTPLDFNTGVDITDATFVELILVRDGGGPRKVFTGTVVLTTKVRYTPVIAADIPEGGSWVVQAHVIQPTRDRRTIPDTLAVIPVI